MELDATLRQGFRLGDWVVRPIEGLVTGAQGARHLQPKTMDVLVSLAASAGQVVTRDELVDRVWGGNAVTDEPLTRCIHEIRRGLGDHRGEPQYIKTIPKRGYQLLAEIRALTAEELAATEVRAGSTENLFWQVTRQRVLWVGALYAILAWLFVQLAEFAESRSVAELAPPAWLMPTLVIIVLCGFPVAIFFAWVRQINVDDKGCAPPPNGIFPSINPLLRSRRGIDMILVTLCISVLAGVALDIVPPTGSYDTAEPAGRIAVMPFDASYDSGGENWLGKGIAEDLRSRLSAFAALEVSSRELSFREALHELDVQQIGQELDIQYLLQGLVVRGPDSMRVNARLIDTVTGFEIWSAAFDRPASELFAVQQEIVAGIAGSLDLQPLQGVPDEAYWPTMLNIAAYDSYLRGRNRLRDAADADSAGLAAAWFQQALAIDQQMPMARIGLCKAYVRELELAGSDWAYSKANQACAAAILQAPDSAPAHLALADYYRITEHVPNAIQEYRWVTERQPKNVDAWLGLARAQWISGEPAAAKQSFRRALDIESNDVKANTAYTRFLLAMGQYEKAADVARKLIRLDRDQPDAYAYLATALFRTGEFEASIQASRQVLSRDISRHQAIMNIADSYYYLGRFGRSGTIYRQAAKLAPADHSAVGGLASSYEQMSTSESLALAQEAFARARLLAENELAENGTDARSIISIAYYCAALGDAECAQRYSSRALELAPADVEIHYRAALMYVQLGQLQQAAAATRSALKLGYPQALIITDPQLAWVHTRQRFATTGMQPFFLRGF